jgi:hypothetical protein
VLCRQICLHFECQQKPQQEGLLNLVQSNDVSSTSDYGV